MISDSKIEVGPAVKESIFSTNSTLVPPVIKWLKTCSLPGLHLVNTSVTSTSYPGDPD